MKKLLISAAVSVCVTTSAFATTLTDAFTSFVVLGDSLSDNGNLDAVTGGLLPGPDYVDGRFSDGPVWNEGILSEFAMAAQFSANLAFGGATTVGGTPPLTPPSLDQQVFSFAGIPPIALGATPLVSVWAGANDIRAPLLALDFAAAPGIATGAADNVALSIEALQGLGVNDFLVFNLPDLGATAELVNSPLSAFGTSVSETFNTQLSSNLNTLRGTGANIIEIDVFGFLADVLADPAASGFTNTTDACLDNLTTCDPATWLFYDGIHPTTAAHSQLEQFVRAEILSTIPLPAGAPLYLLALAGFGLVARRRA